MTLCLRQTESAVRISTRAASCGRGGQLSQTQSTQELRGGLATVQRPPIPAASMPFFTEREPPGTRDQLLFSVSDAARGSTRKQHACRCVDRVCVCCAVKAVHQ